MNTLVCNVWCSEHDQMRDLGLPDGDCWMPIAVDLSKVVTIKLAGPNAFIGNDKATLYLISGSIVIVDVPF